MFISNINNFRLFDACFFSTCFQKIERLIKNLFLLISSIWGRTEAVVPIRHVSMEIPEEAIQLIQDNWESIKNRKNSQEVEDFSTSPNPVFQLKKYPQWIFKMINPKNGNRERLFNRRIERTRAVLNAVQENGYNHLYVPKYRTLQIRNREGVESSFIVEEFLQVHSEEEMRDALNREPTERIAPSLKELVCLIHKVGVSDILTRNFSFIKEEGGKPYRLALLDLEERSGNREFAIQQLFRWGLSDPLKEVIRQELRALGWEDQRIRQVELDSGASR